MKTGVALAVGILVTCQFCFGQSATARRKASSHGPWEQDTHWQDCTNRLGKIRAESERMIKEVDYLNKSDRANGAQTGVIGRRTQTSTQAEAVRERMLAQEKESSRLSAQMEEIRARYELNMPTTHTSTNLPAKIHSIPASDILAKDKASANASNPDGLVRMGERYQLGDGVPKDMTKARELYQKAADLGSSEAKSALKNLPKAQ